MRCWIYKGERRDETYLYVAAPGDLDAVPAALRAGFGELELVMELELSETRRLARADVIKVMQELADKGYYLQLPPPPRPE
jgi:hypothetical protein